VHESDMLHQLISTAVKVACHQVCHLSSISVLGGIPRLPSLCALVTSELLVSAINTHHHHCHHRRRHLLQYPSRENRGDVKAVTCVRIRVSLHLPCPLSEAREAAAQTFRCIAIGRSSHREREGK
jgi:hypothetical protein